MPEVCRLIREGTPMEPACAIVGVSIETVRDAIDRGDPATEPLAAARAHLEAGLARALLDHAVSGKPHGAAAYMLERVAPKRWKQPDKIHMGQDEDAGPVRVQTTPPTEAELRARLEALRARLGD